MESHLNTPRMWGKLSSVSPFGIKRQTIPTHVGKTMIRRLAPLLTADHPHACGENYFMLISYVKMLGPSPRMWGKLHISHRHALSIRTIPTHVGKTKTGIRWRLGGSDHPHACGENGVNHVAEGFGLGPSPRMWGKLLRVIHHKNYARTIPTHVGKTQLL